MRALVSYAGNPNPSVENVPSPELGPQDVRVEVAAAGITYFDSFVATDHEAFGLPDAIGLGFDFSGRILEVGSQVTEFDPGDRVAGMHVDPSAPSRAQAEEVVVPASGVGRLPADTSMEAAAAVTLSALTARQALDLLGDTRGRLLVTGAAGSVGGWVVALAGAEGWTVDALIRPGGRHPARPDGVGAVVTDIPDAIYDAVIDAAALQDAAIAAVRAGGQFVGVKPGRDVAPERGINVSTVLARPDGAMLAELLEYAAKGLAPVRIAAARPLSQAAQAYADAVAAPGSAGRWLLIP